MAQTEQKASKNLWKSIRTEKAKYSMVVAANGPAVNSSKQGSLNSQTHHIVHSEPVSQKGIGLQLQNYLEQNFEQQPQANLQERIESYYPADYQEQAPQEEDSDVRQPRQNYGTEKFSKFSANESVIEEVRDLKDTHFMNTIGFDEEQQPMMISLDSNYASKQLKLCRVKQELQRVKSIEGDIITYVHNQSVEYRRELDNNFNMLIAYIVDFYSSRQECLQQKPAHSRQGSTEFKYQNAQPLSVPRIQNINQQQIINVKEKLQKAEQDIQRLEEQLFKYKMQLQMKEEQLTEVIAKNETMEEQVFDLEQKQAQIELEIKQRVEEQIEKRLKEQATSPRFNQNNQQQIQLMKHEYISHIQQLQIKLNQLQVKARSESNNQIRMQQIQEKQRMLRHRERELEQVETQIQQHESYLNELKADYEQKYEKLRVRQTELRNLSQSLELKEQELIIKENQLFTREHNVESIIPNEQFEESHAQYRVQRTNSNHSFDKINNWSSIKPGPKNYKSKIDSSTKYGVSYGYTPPLSSETRIHHQRLGSSHSGSKQKQDRSIKKYAPFNYRPQVVPKTSVSSNKSSFVKSSAHKINDKSRLDDLGSKLENLRQQIRKQIKEAS